LNLRSIARVADGANHSGLLRAVPSQLRDRGIDAGALSTADRHIVATA
jgi:hypothetical protein